ncbi:MAG: hypothetical protein HZC17_09905 [Candidatus Omnitrophica bacterium]|nr:hypothetical protein [Candidatus Omnitrophota bacterium]
MKILRAFILITFLLPLAPSSLLKAAQTELSGDAAQSESARAIPSEGLRPAYNDVDSVKPPPPVSATLSVDPTTVEDISDRNYLEKVCTLLQGAKESIYVSMYVSNPKVSETHPVGKLFQALADAASRGVKVSVWLNSSFNEETVLDRKKYDDFWADLQKKGIKIQWVSSGARLHDKLVVVDREYVVEGSTNWTFAALQKNFESDTLIRSKPLAGKKIERLEGFPLEKPESLNPLQTTFVEIPAEFFTNGALLPKIVAANDREAWDLFFNLMTIRKVQGEGLWKLKSADIASVLENRAAKDARKIKPRKVLDRLEKKYHLLTCEFIKKDDTFQVQLVELGSDPRLKMVRIPVAFYQYGYQKQWSLSAQFAYGISLIMASESKTKPYWMSPMYQLEKRFSVGEKILREGLTELKRENAVEFVFSKKSGDESKMSARLLFSYRNNPLRSEEEKETELLKVRNQLASLPVEDWKRARAYAEMFDDPYDTNLTKQFAELAKTYPAPMLEPVIMRVAQFSPDNSLRSPEYIKKILERK